MVTTLLILLLSTIFFIHGKIRSDIVALCALALLMIFKILTPEEALSGFSNSVVIMMVGLFVVGGAILKTGLAKIIGSKILYLAGKSELKLLVLIMLVTSFIGAFVSNTGTVALMLPIIVSMAAKANISTSRFLMPLAFASSMGGMTTLIGTPPNLVIEGILSGAGFHGISFFSFTPVGLICIATGMAVLIPLSKFFLVKKTDIKKNKPGSNRHSPKELTKKYQIIDNLYRIHVVKKSTLQNKSLAELNITDKYGLNVLEIRRKSSSGMFMKTVDQKLAGPNLELKVNDILYVFGPFEKVTEFIQDYHLELAERKETEYADESSQEKLRVQEIGIAEVLLLPESKLINQLVKDSGFRSNYSINVLGIQRGGEYLLSNVKDIRLRGGDILLVQGNWDDIARLSQEQSEWVVLGQPLEAASKVTLDYKAPMAAGIMFLMILSMVLNVLPPVTSVIIAAVLMVLTGCFRNVEEAYKTINWESIVLIAAMMPMSMALEKTGASKVITHGLVSGLGGYGPLVLMAGLYFTTSLLTMFISNTATAVLVAPIAMQAALSINVSPYAFLMAVAVGASMCFASPFSTPPNALVMAAGKYTFMDYIKVGLPLQIIMGVIMVLLLPFLFPF